MSALANSTAPKDRYAGAPAPRPWPFSSQRLVDGLAAGRYLPPSTLTALVADATASGRSIVDLLLERRLATDVALRDAMSAIYGLPLVDLATVEPSDDVDDLSPELALRALVMPLGSDGDRFVVA